MAAKDRDNDRSFLARWSQRKQEAAEGAAEPEAVAPQPAPGPAGAEAVDVSALPDIDSMDAGSDFSVFMRGGVPQALKRRALRRLWQVDPAFHEICMLDDYNLDYTDAAMVVPNLKTVYQVGRGMVPPEEDLERLAGIRDTPAPDAGAGAPAPASPASPDPVKEEIGAETPPDAVAGELPAAQAGAPESAPPEESRDRAAPVAAAQGEMRSARRRRWGDTEA